MKPEEDPFYDDAIGWGYSPQHAKSFSVLAKRAVKLEASVSKLEASVAQSEEHRPSKPVVGGSIPSGRAIEDLVTVTLTAVGIAAYNEYYAALYPGEPHWVPVTTPGFQVTARHQALTKILGRSVFTP